MGLRVVDDAVPDIAAPRGDAMPGGVVPRGG
jgi:hypothetical protein